MNIQQTLTLSNHHQTNKQAEPCIKFVKHTITNALTLTGIFSFIADTFNTNRNRSPKSYNDAVQQADKGLVASNE